MSFMNEVAEQPAVLELLADSYFRQNKDMERITTFLDSIEYNKIVFTGMGSSTYAAYLASLFLRERNINSVMIESGELVRNQMEYLSDDTLLVIVSQTGASKEAVELSNKVKGTLPVLAVVNNTESEIAKNADCVMGIYSGKELYTSSKSYTNTLAAMIILARLLAEKKRPDDLEKEFRDCAEEMRRIIGDTAKSAELTEFLDGSQCLFLIGSGYSYATASHGEIVIGEAAKMLSSRHTTGQFLHGAVEMVREGYSYMIFDSNAGSKDKTDQIIRHVLKMKGKVVHVGVEKYPTDDRNYFYFPVSYASEVLAPIIEVIPVELFINYYGVKHDLNPGVLSFIPK